ncbi:MAG: ferrous iron transport protein B [Chloroflexi bacterium]|nr:ferrous iron transport protein B [Chloroflexota bacterium]
MNCHTEVDTTRVDEAPVILVGNPNVGKSVLFGALTGRYVAVSNYPGTTVEIAQGSFTPNGHPRPLIDTPGIQSLIPFSDDERVTRDILLESRAPVIVQVIDTKNLRRGLLIALELAESGLPLVVCLNMADEAQARGIRVDTGRLAEALGVPVISAVAVQGQGVSELTDALEQARSATCQTSYTQPIEEALSAIGELLPVAAISPRSLALMLLAGDDALLRRLNLSLAAAVAVQGIRQATEKAVGQPLIFAINRQRMRRIEEILAAVMERTAARPTIATLLGHWAVHPVAGWPILLIVLYAVYRFVGVFGAGTLVDLLESRVFGEWIMPWVIGLVEFVTPRGLIRDFLVGEYGLFPVALTYSFAIVLPIVATFFLTFSLLEDSGYLPRLAVVLDRAFRWMGLNGKAVLPMILGLGCDTMATMTTRILESRKERIQVTLLLALGVPCSAQLGVILGMIAGLGAKATAIWAGVIVATLLAVGYLSARLLPGERSDFILELPPMRMPALGNIALKTAARMEWYLKEVVPVFVAGTAALFVLDRLRILGLLERLLSPLIVGWLGLPAQVTDAFLVGFLRRDYGAAGLFAIARDGGLDPIQIVVSLVVITLFMPCIANLLMIVKEYGTRTAIAVTAVVFPLAFLIGGALNAVLRAFSVAL